MSMLTSVHNEDEPRVIPSAVLGRATANASFLDKPAPGVDARLALCPAIEETAERQEQPQSSRFKSAGTNGTIEADAGNQARARGAYSARGGAVPGSPATHF